MSAKAAVATAHLTANSAEKRARQAQELAGLSLAEKTTQLKEQLTKAREIPQGKAQRKGSILTVEIKLLTTYNCTTTTNGGGIPFAFENRKLAVAFLRIGL